MDLKSKAMLSVAETVRNMYNPKPIQPVEEASMMKDTGEVVHNCAKHVEHTTWGKGTTMAEQHDAPDEAGNIGWYDVLFAHGLEKAVPTANLNILVSENHGHPMKKKKMAAEALHPNQQKLDVHEPEKDELTADDFKKLRAGKKAMGKEDTEVKEALSGDNSRNAENDKIKEKALQAVKDASAKTANTQATPGQVNGAKIGGETELIHQGVKEEVEVDETIIYKTIGYDIQEADDNYDAHFKAHMKKAGIKHPGELKTDAEKKAFFNKVDAGFKAKNEDVFLEALLSADVLDRIKSHEAAGHKVSDKANRMKNGEQEYSFVVTQPSGKRSRHIYHGSKVKHETMSPAPKSKEASEIGDDEDDK